MRLSIRPIRLSLKGQMASYWIAGAANSGMGSAAIVGAASVANFKHVILNICVHDSVGGMATVHASIGQVLYDNGKPQEGTGGLQVGSVNATETRRHQPHPKSHQFNRMRSFERTAA